MIDPYEIKLRSNDPEVDGVITLNYDLSLTVSKLKTKLKEIIMTIQCYGDQEWLPSSSELATYTMIRHTLNSSEAVNKL